jgi:hypothetical protein
MHGGGLIVPSENFSTGTPFASRITRFGLAPGRSVS